MMSGEMKTDKDKSLLQVMEEYKEYVNNYNVSTHIHKVMADNRY